MEEYHKYGWHHGSTSRDEAISILSTHPTGSWLVRYSVNNKKHILSGVFEDKDQLRYAADPSNFEAVRKALEKARKYKHFIISETGYGSHKKYYLKDKFKFSHILDLLKHYQAKPFEPDSLEYQPLLTGKYVEDLKKQTKPPSERPEPEAAAASLTSARSSSSVTPGGGAGPESRQELLLKELMFANNAASSRRSNLQPQPSARHLISSSSEAANYMHMQSGLGHMTASNQGSFEDIVAVDEELYTEPIDQAASSEGSRVMIDHLVVEAHAIAHEMDGLKRHLEQLASRLKSHAKDISAFKTASAASATSTSADPSKHDQVTQSARDSSSWTATVKVSSSGKEMPTKPGAFFQCIKSYAPEQPDELELQVGDIVRFSEEIEKGWWKGKKNQVEGVFPSSYVRSIN